MKKKEMELSVKVWLLTSLQIVRSASSWTSFVSN